MEEIIKTNLKKMVNNGEGDMLPLLPLESMRGDYWKNYPCQRANFYYDKIYGEIKFFGNIQHVPEPLNKNSKKAF